MQASSSNDYEKSNYENKIDLIKLNNSATNQLNELDNGEQEAKSNCTLHNLEDEFCSSSSGCSSTTVYEDEDDCSIIDYSDSEDDATSSSSESCDSKAWRKNWTMSKVVFFKLIN